MQRKYLIPVLLRLQLTGTDAAKHRGIRLKVNALGNLAGNLGSGAAIYRSLTRVAGFDLHLVTIHTSCRGVEFQDGSENT
jgi:hypothetical protein